MPWPTTVAEVVALVGTLATVLSALGLLAVNTASAVKQRAETRALMAQMTPDSGSSLRDAVDRIESELRGIRRDIGRHGDELVDLRRSADETHRDLSDRITDLARKDNRT